ncbi:neugrin-like isoform X1 [Antedon mediterranea]|uniref:neugrin-like isoform X1 n=2 Tax=Antedon mediterranea TaxID=105859 RepID=UPI003AF8A03D
MLSMKLLRSRLVYFVQLRPTDSAISKIHAAKINFSRFSTLTNYRPNIEPFVVSSHPYSQVIGTVTCNSSTWLNCKCLNKNSRLSNLLIFLRRYRVSPTLCSKRGSGRRGGEYDSTKLDGKMETEINKRLSPLDYDEENDSEVLEKILKDQNRRQKAMRYNRIRRQFPQPKEPRLLTTNMIQQIRFLYQEHPEEWNIKRLADGFTVSQDAIRKVLHSKFVPQERNMEKMDKIALKNRSLLLGDAQRVYVETNNALPEGFRNVPTQDLIESGKRQSAARYLGEGDRKSKNYKKRRLFRSKES